MERQQYNWFAGNGTVSVSLPSDVISRLRNAPLSVDGSTEEIGGILLGRRESEDRISIQDFAVVSSEHRRGLTFTLSGPDKHRLSQRIRARQNGLVPLGLFRTHLRQGLYMDQYDFELMSEFFAAGTDVMLLIRPSDWQAGFFVWEEDEISRQKSYMEFPFDPALLPLTPSREAVAPPQDQPATAARRRVPTLMRAGLIAGTIGLAGVLAFYTHNAREHRYSVQPKVASIAIAKPSAFTSPPMVEAVYPPIDPDVQSGTQNNQYELHVKVPGPDGDSSSQSRNRSSVISIHSQPNKPYQGSDTTEAALPPAPLQTALNLPPTPVTPALARAVLKPVQPALVSEVSLEVAQPGVIRRSLHHVPVLNLFGKHNYKSGDDFSPARPLREVKPELLDNNARQTSVDVRVWIDEKGEVTKTELITDHVEPEVADIASNAANKWRFAPARISDHPVSSEMVMHFHFVPQTTY